MVQLFQMLHEYHLLHNDLIVVALHLLDQHMLADATGTAGVQQLLLLLLFVLLQLLQLHLLIVQILNLLHERLVAHMDFDVIVQCAGLAELFLADGALERLLAGVDLLVIGQRAQLSEHFAAERAAERFLAGVDFRVIR